jgi:hypothetical protein
MGLNLNFGLKTERKYRYKNGPDAILGIITKGYILVINQRNSMEMKLKVITE